MKNNLGSCCHHLQLKKMVMMMSLFVAEQKICASTPGQNQSNGIEQGSVLIMEDARCAKIVAMLNAAVEDGRKKFDGIGKSSTPSAFVDSLYAPLCHNAWAAHHQSQGIAVKDSGKKDGQMYVTVFVPQIKTPATKTAGGLFASVYRMIGWGQ